MDSILAIEIDKNRPRTESILKLKQVKNAKRIIILRGGHIDAIKDDKHIIPIVNIIPHEREKKV